MNTEPLTKAIEIAGSRYKLAKLIGLRPPSVYRWKQVPADRVIDVEAATGVSRHELRSDIFGPAPEQQAAP